MKKSLLAIGIFTLVSCVAALSPTEIAHNASLVFAQDFFARVDNNWKSTYVVSPGAVQKFLAVLYMGTSEDDFAKGLLVDIRARPTFKRNRNEWYSLQTVDSKPSVTDMEEFFENHFTEISNLLTYENYIVPATNFNKTEFGKTYFHMNYLTHDEWKAKNDKSFDPIMDDKTYFFTSLAANLHFKDKFVEYGGRLYAITKYEYCEHKGIKALRIPLESNVPLTLTIYLSNGGLGYKDFLYSLGFYDNYLSEFEDKFTYKVVDITLPLLKWDNLTILHEYFQMNGEKKGMLAFCNYDIAMENMININPYMRLSQFWQSTRLQITPAAGKKDNYLETPEVQYDAATSSFVFTVTSRNAVYFMGTHWVPGNEF